MHRLLGAGFILAAGFASAISEASPVHGLRGQHTVVKQDLTAAKSASNGVVHRVGPRETIMVSKHVTPAAQLASLQVEFTFVAAKDPTVRCRPCGLGARETVKRC